VDDIRILIIEEDPTEQFALSELVHDFDYLTDFVSSIDEALNFVSHTKYVAVLINTEMQTVDGFACAESIREYERLRCERVPIIGVCTAFGAGARAEARAGANAGASANAGANAKAGVSVGIGVGAAAGTNADTQAFADAKKACVERGMDDVLLKPYSGEELRQSLLRWAYQWCNPNIKLVENPLVFGLSPFVTYPG
jgi:CheY-like chemotaxis protein